MKRYLKHYLPLFLLAAAGLFLFLTLLDGFYPYEAANIRLSRKQAIQVATEFMQDQEFQLDGYHIRTVMGYDNETFTYLQRRFGYDAAKEMVQYKSHHGIDFAWVVFWFKNLPNNAVQERFWVGLARNGDVVAFHHGYPATYEWPRPERARLPQNEALDIALDFLDRYDVDLEGFTREHFSTQEDVHRDNHIFRWTKIPESQESTVELKVEVHGDRVSDFDVNFHIPEEATTEIKRESGTQYFFFQVVPIIVFFTIGLISLFIFLKKYHEGEVEVKTGRILFIVIWISFALQAVIKFRLNAAGTTLSELSLDGIALFILVLLLLIARPIFTLFGFTAWSVGESFGRERFSKKFTAFDCIINRRLDTLDLARSILQGFLGGLASLGFIAVIFWMSLHWFQGTTTISGFQRILPVSLPWLVPVLVAISGALLGEIVFRLFVNLLAFRILKVKLFAVLLSSVLWAFYVPQFWGIHLHLSPLDFSIMAWFLLGLFWGYLFWRYDLFTVIMANFFTMGVMQALPLITSPSTVNRNHGLIALALIFSPLAVMLLGFIRRKRFFYQTDLVPEHIKRITQRVRMAKELEIARQVQMRLLPKESPRLPGFDITGICLPAQEVGGDYFDFIELGKSKLGIVIGDVSGKGVPAAIYMTLTKGIVQSHADDFISPSQVLKKVNDLLYRTIDKDAFVSLFYAVLDVKKKSIIYSRAGHNPVLYFNAESGRCEKLEPDGIALGLENGVVFNRVIKECQMKLNPGDLLVFYTDGFSEAMNTNMEEYGEERLMALIEANHGMGVEELYRHVLHEINGFVKEAPQHDDMTMIFIKGQ